ncbi:MAG: RNA polymerase subunit sigma, partial [Chloroflexi bacterium]|nr:RNA polymerase subunit sigma [Chloroflexota bacterium]
MDRLDQSGQSDRSKLSDEQLVEALAAGDDDALSVLYDRYAKAVFSLAARITRDQSTAEEVTQEVFVRTWRSAATY